TWRVQVEQDLPAGTAVEVVDVQGITLLVRPIDIG
ncbi:MAG: NfeD family protein, partial [Plesiomonas shigelloides]